MVSVCLLKPTCWLEGTQCPYLGWYKMAMWACNARHKYLIFDMFCGSGCGTPKQACLLQLRVTRILSKTWFYYVAPMCHHNYGFQALEPGSWPVTWILPIGQFPWYIYIYIYPAFPCVSNKWIQHNSTLILMRRNNSMPNGSRVEWTWQTPVLTLSTMPSSRTSGSCKSGD